MSLTDGTLFDSQRMGFDEALEMTENSLKAYAPRYRHWAVAYSGGKDSSTAVTVVAHLVHAGRVPPPALASLPFDNVNPDGSVQPIMRELLVAPI